MRDALDESNTLHAYKLQIEATRARAPFFVFNTCPLAHAAVALLRPPALRVQCNACAHRRGALSPQPSALVGVRAVALQLAADPVVEQELHRRHGRDHRQPRPQPRIGLSQAAARQLGHLVAEGPCGVE